MIERIPEPTVFKDEVEKRYLNEMLRVIRNNFSDLDLATNSNASSLKIGSTLLQWGLSAGGASSGTITFDRAFKSTPYAVFGTLVGATDSNALCVSSVGASSFDFYSEQSFAFYWIAIGPE